MIPSDIMDELLIASRLWGEAEKTIKLSEKLSGDALIPAINELRYAGRRMANAITAYYDMESGSDKDREIKRHLTEARENCLKADHDAVDAIVYYIEKRLEELESFVGPSNIKKFFPGYTEIIKKINQVSENMSKSRDGKKDSREQRYNKIKQDLLPDIIDFYSSIGASEDRILVDHIRKQKREKIHRWLAIGGSVIGVVGSVITIVQWLF